MTVMAICNEVNFLGFEQLTEREREILDQMVIRNNIATKDIAAALFLSDRTVQFHLQKIFNKIGVRNKTSLCMAYLRHLEKV